MDIGLSSLTVFWEDLGIKDLLIHNQELAKWWDSDLGPWLDEFIKGEYRPYGSGVWFLDRKDAMLFKLTWAGQWQPK